MPILGDFDIVFLAPLFDDTNDVFNLVVVI